jgi:hypothetical protein
MRSRRIDRELAWRLHVHGGLTLSDIASYFGVLKQAVHQALVDTGWPLGRPWAPRGSARLVQDETIKRWIAQGWVSQSQSGLYNTQEAFQTYVRLMTRPCEYPDCTEPIGNVQIRSRFCPRHSLMTRKYRYPVLTAEQRATWWKNQARWRKAHWDTYAPKHAKYAQAWKERRKQAQQAQQEEHTG